MKFNTYCTRRWRSASVAAMFICLLGFAADYATSHSGGMTGVTQKTGDANGCTCHCANLNTATSVTLSTSATVFEINTAYTFTVTVSNSNEVNGGVDISAFTGTLAAGNDGLQSLSGQLTHNGPKTLPATWTFTYTAPSTAQTDTIYATGNAVNGDGGNGSGNCADKWNNASKFVITVTAPNRAITVGRNAISIGNKRVGGSYTDTTKVSSTGDAILTISSSPMKTATIFTSTPTASRTLNAGTSETNTITFAPVAKGAFSDSLIINSNTSIVLDQRKAIYVSGTGIQAVFNGLNAIPFGSVKVGSNKQLTYTFTNSGDDTMFVNAPTLGGNSGAFSIVTALSPTTILAGGTASITLKYSPGSKQVHTGTLTMSATNGVVIPVINLVGTGIAPVLTVASQTDIGLARVGLTRNGNVSISNGGDDDLHISSITVSPLYSGPKFIITSPTALTIPISGASSMAVTYTPTAERSDTALITINSDDPALSSKQIFVIASAGSPKMGLLTTDTIRFGDVRVGVSAQSFALQVKNNGTYDLTVLSITPSPSVFSVVSKPSSVSPKASAQAILKFTPSAPGKVVGMAIITGDDGTNPSDTIYMIGNGTTSSFDVPSGISFGDMKVGTTRDSSLWLKNLGSAALRIVKYSLANPNNGFVLTDTAAHTINAKDSVKIKVTFNAFQEISYAGTITITTDEISGNTRMIELSGRGVNSKLTLTPSGLDFGSVDVGKTSSKTFVITNTGTAASTIKTFALTGSNEFKLDSSYTPFTIAPSGSKTISLTFTVVSVGTADGSLAITAAEGSPLQLPLHGVGLDTAKTSVRVVNDIVESMNIIPNPAREKATLQLTLKRNASDLRIEFYDAAAHLISTQQMGGIPADEQHIALQLPQTSGVVFIRISSGGSVISTAQIVITR